MSARTSKLFSWSKSDAVFLEIILWGAFAASLAFGVVRPLLGITGLAGWPAQWEGVVSRPDGMLAPVPSAVSVTASDVTVLGTDRVMVELADPTAAGRALLYLPDLLAGVLVVVAVLLVVQIARTLRSGTPFQVGNFRRVLVVGAITAIGSVLVTGVETFTSALLNELAFGTPAAIFQPPIVGIIAGLIIMAFAQIFILGHRLQQDTEGLV